MSNEAEPSSSIANLTAIKETLGKMLQAVQDDLRKVDSEWTQLCSVAAMQTTEAQSSTVAEKCAAVNAALLDDPDVVNNMELQL